MRGLGRSRSLFPGASDSPAVETGTIGGVDRFDERVGGDCRREGNVFHNGSLLGAGGTTKDRALHLCT